MTKENQNSNGKIVYFPGLKDRLLEKGVQALEKGDIHVSSELLTQAYELDPENPDINTALVLSLYEGKEYEQAKTICKEMLLEGIGDYFEVVDMYIMILIQLHQHTEVVETIHALFDEKEVPFEKEDHFKKLLHFSEKVLNGKEPLPSSKEIVQQTSILKGKSLEEQTILVAELVHRNIRPFLLELELILKDSDAHPFLQTMILNVFREHGIEKEVVVSKLKKQEVVRPSTLQDMFESEIFTETVSEIEDLLQQRNPTLLQHVLELYKRHSFLMYPFPLQGKQEDLAIVYGFYTASMFSDTVLEDELREHIEGNPDCEPILHKLKELEEISSPTI
ncbi:tetratricopeptide repeat protein [Rossellomorea aquimaris]|uniref:tetratricopeptide repeat protein n=1 Tax=Rossellomorea aquimaris TaxID=189382 RepID=UPI0007D076AB|nr:tetratricopeptide repeat protein [Rossellomorea aquimaris]